MPGSAGPVSKPETNESITEMKSPRPIARRGLNQLVLMMALCQCFARRVKLYFCFLELQLHSIRREIEQRLEDLGRRNLQDGQWMCSLALGQAGPPAPHRGPVFVIWCVRSSLRRLIGTGKDAAGRRGPRSEPSLEVALWRGRKRRVGRNKRHRHIIARIEGGSIRFSGRHSPQNPHVFGTGRGDAVRVLEIPLMLRNVSGRARRRHHASELRRKGWWCEVESPRRVATFVAEHLPKTYKFPNH